MIKRVLGATMAVCMLVAMFASVAMAAPAGGSAWQDPGAGWQVPWYSRWQPFPVWPGWGYSTYLGTGLGYHLSYVPEANELVLYVYNPTDKPVTVSQPTALMADFVLWQNGQMVWRASANKSYAQVVISETIKPGEGKVYKESLPWLPAGTYFAQAYYLGETKWAPVASSYIWAQAYEPLKYTVEYLAPTWSNPNPRLRVTIKNLSDKDITLPYQYGYQILVKKAGASEYLPNVGMGQSLGTIEKGATRYVFVNLSGLTPGTYQVDVRSNVAHLGWYSVVAQTWFWNW
ncbi:MAG TPA: hypothetical protein GX529_02275 [Firmicutes bacterium]|nr:hypothetical protein [Candidatus Fermentithermobacillaceae bacterium]